MRNFLLGFAAGLVCLIAFMVAPVPYTPYWLDWQEEKIVRAIRSKSEPLVVVIGQRDDAPEEFNDWTLQNAGGTFAVSEYRDPARAKEIKHKVMNVLGWVGW